MPTMMPPGTQVKLRDLDPGIRDVVSAFWSAGIETSDSGDGVSKPEFARVMDCEHVAVVPGPKATLGAVKRILERVRPGETWQVEHTVSITLGQGHDRSVTTILTYRLDGPVGG